MSPPDQPSSRWNSTQVSSASAQPALSSDSESVTIDNAIAGGVNVSNTSNNATTIDVDALGTGDITFDQDGTGALTVTKLNTGNGDITLTSESATTVNSITTRKLRKVTLHCYLALIAMQAAYC